MVSLRSGTDTEDNDRDAEVSSARRSSHLSKQQGNTPVQASKRGSRAGKKPHEAAHLRLTSLQEEEDLHDRHADNSAGEDEWPLAQRLLAALLADDEDQARRAGGKACGPQAPEKLRSGLRGLGQEQHQPAGPAMDSRAGQEHVPDALTGEEETLAELHWQPTSHVAVPGAAPERPGLPLLTADGHAYNQLSLGPRDKTSDRRKALRQAPKTAGRDWFDLPATHIDDKMKRDLRLLRLRAAMDPKRFYKAPDRTRFPTYFQVGTVVEGPADFHTGRMTRKERKQSITEELLADKALGQQRKRRFGRLQGEKQRWAGRRGRKTDNPRIKKHRKAPKY